MARPFVPVAERFWSKVSYGEAFDCWLWTGALYHDGYGAFGPGGRGASPQRAHRVSYELLIGEIPEGLQLDHLCHDPKKCLGGLSCPHRRCVNPYHLDPVPSRVNSLRGGAYSSKREAKLTRRPEYLARTECKKGHSYKDGNGYLNALGYWICRKCAKESDRARYLSKKGAS